MFQLHEEKQESEREHFDFEKSSENLSEAIGIDQEHQHSDIDVEEEEDDDMDKQLNPEAAEFVPTSPPTSAPISPFSNGTAALISNRPDLLDDDLLAQSPRKSVAPAMEDFPLPSENDFSEISKRPSELRPTSPTDLNASNGDIEQRPGSSSSQCSYQEMNLKEAMHADEKQEFAAEVSDANILNVEPTAATIDLLQSSEHAVDILNRSLHEQDPMHMSFYNDRTENGLPQTNPFAEPEVDMNAVQQLPDSDDEERNERDDFDVLVSDVVVQNNGITKEEDVFGVSRDGFDFSEGGQDIMTKQDLIDVVESSRTQWMSPTTEVEFEAGVPLSSVSDQFYSGNQEILMAENELINVNESSPITQVVQEMASEVTSILNEIDEHHQNAEQSVADHQSEFNIRDLSNDAVADVINKSDLSAVAGEFHPSFVEVAQSPIEPEELVSIVDQVSTIQTIEPIEQTQSNGIPEPVEPEHDEPKVDLLAAAGVVTAAAITAAVVATAKSPSPTKEPKVTAATKKPTALAAKKPATAPLKTTLKSTVSTARTSATSPSKTLASKTTTTTAPKPAVRTVKAAVEKKTTATLTAAAKKPITNGVATTTTIKKTTTTLTATKSTAGAPKPAVHATKTTTLRTTTAATSAAPAKTSTLSKPATTTASARVPLSAR